VSAGRALHEPWRSRMGSIRSCPTIRCRISCRLTVPSKGFKTLGDLIAAAKARPGTRPGKLNFASAGIGSGSHFAAERLRISAGFEAQHIPFGGAREGLTEALAGRVDFFFVPLAPALPLIKDGKLVALAVSAASWRPLARVPPAQFFFTRKDPRIHQAAAAKPRLAAAIKIRIFATVPGIPFFTS
jgi:Tripartite tricarboxylate transporter family receptor